MSLLRFQRDFIYFLIKNKYKKSTIQAYKYGLKDFLSFLERNKLTINDMDEYNLDKYKKSLLKNKMKTSININLSCLKKYYEFLNRYKKIASHIDLGRIKQIKIDKMGKNNIEFKQLSSMFDVILKKKDIISKRDYIIFQLISKTGIRISELVKIKKDDLKDNKIFINGNEYILDKELIKKINHFIGNKDNLKKEYLLVPYRSRKNSKNSALTVRSVERIIKKYFPEYSYNDLKLVYYDFLCSELTDIKIINEHKFYEKNELQDLDKII